MKEEAPVDGLNTYCFPFTFYTYCARCDKGFNFINLLADIGLLSMVTYFIIRLKNKMFGAATLLLTAFILTSCRQTVRDKEVDPNNLDSVILVQVNHPYLSGRIASKQLEKKYFRDFLNDFVDKKETVVKFYSCYVIKLYFKSGQWVSYRTNGHAFEKLKDEFTNGVYFQLDKDINLVKKYWGIPQDKFCDTDDKNGG